MRKYLLICRVVVVFLRMVFYLKVGIIDWVVLILMFDRVDIIRIIRVEDRVFW